MAKMIVNGRFLVWPILVGFRRITLEKEIRDNIYQFWKTHFCIILTKIIVSNLVHMKFTFWSNSTSLYNISKFVTNAQKSRSTTKISLLLLYTESQTIIWNSIFSATLLYNKSCQAFNIFQNWIDNIKKISPGHFLKIAYLDKCHCYTIP